MMIPIFCNLASQNHQFGTKKNCWYCLYYCHKIVVTIIVVILIFLNCCFDNVVTNTCLVVLANHGNNDFLKNMDIFLPTKPRDIQKVQHNPAAHQKMLADILYSFKIILLDNLFRKNFYQAIFGVSHFLLIHIQL